MVGVLASYCYCNIFHKTSALRQKILLFYTSGHQKYKIFFSFTLFYFTILYWFCHTSTWLCHGCTWVPNPEPLSHLPPHTISLGHPSAPGPSILYPALNVDWWFVSYMILYMFRHSPKSSHPLPLPQSPKECSIHLCLFCCLAYRVIVIIFLNSIICVSINTFDFQTTCPLLQTSIYSDSSPHLLWVSPQGYWRFCFLGLKVLKIPTE